MNRRRHVLGLAAVIALTLGLATSSAQVLVGLRSEWSDMSTWTRVLESREVEHGMGLHANGPVGQTMIAFMGVLSARDPTLGPKELSVQVSTGRMTNPNLVRVSRLTLVADEGSPNAKTLELTSRLVVDNPSPGAIITDGVGRIAGAEFARLASAKSIKGNILGFDFTLRADQVAAIKTFATKLKLAR